MCDQPYQHALQTAGNRERLRGTARCVAGQAIRNEFQARSWLLSPFHWDSLLRSGSKHNFGRRGAIGVEVDERLPALGQRPFLDPVELAQSAVVEGRK